MKTVAVIGGGAAGMAAALTAARGGSRVLLYERQQRVGKKLLATGNGRCNLTNTGAGPENYHGEAPDFAKPALSRFSPESDLSFFRELGLATVTEYGGRVYPLSNSANSVLDVLRRALDAAGVETRCSQPVKELKRSGSRFLILTETDRQEADAVIMACGGAAGAKVGGVSDGYELMKALGHRRTKIYPALVPVTTEPEYPRALKGVRADGRVRLQQGDKILGESTGEIQFTDNGVSGPCVFDISRSAAAYADSGLTVHMDLLREYTDAEVLQMLTACRKAYPQSEAGDLFTGILHNRLGRMLVKYSGIAAAEPAGEVTDRQLRTLARAAKDFTLKVRGTGDFGAAQVTAGGLCTDQFRPDTLESRVCKGLFACGEVLDIDGDCGGYNLHWAWASGRLAGRLGE